MKIKKYKYVFTHYSTLPQTISFGNRDTPEREHVSMEPIWDYFDVGEGSEYSETELAIMLLKKIKIYAKSEEYFQSVFELTDGALTDSNNKITEAKQQIEIWEEKVRVLKEKPEYIFEIVQQ